MASFPPPSRGVLPGEGPKPPRQRQPRRMPPPRPQPGPNPRPRPRQPFPQPNNESMMNQGLEAFRNWNAGGGGGGVNAPQLAGQVGLQNAPAPGLAPLPEMQLGGFTGLSKKPSPWEESPMFNSFGKGFGG